MRGCCTRTLASESVAVRVFLSYSTPDHAAADDMRRDLLARRPELDLYFAPRRNDAGAYWIARLEAELRTTDAVLLLLGRRVGPWQELEYYDALRRNRQAGRPLIAPVLLMDVAPGLPFLDQLHRLSREDHSPETLINLILQALDGAEIGDQEPTWRLVNPYRGLLAMETQDAAYFFGREDLTGQILTRIATQPDRIQALVGNSGVGKSSVAMAGVLAALKSRLWPGDLDSPWPQALDGSPGWPVLVLRPGEAPVKALAQACAGLWLDSPAEIEGEALKWQRLLMVQSSLSALVDATLEQLGVRAGAEAPTRLMLYVDQCEELYTRSDGAEARRFSTLLAGAVRRPHLLAMLSLRSDHYGHFQEDADLFQSANRIDVTPLDLAGIERVIRLPAERLGVRFEPQEGISHIAQAATREPGALPMLSDLLADAWRAMARDEHSAGVLRMPLQIVDISRPLADKAERFLALHQDRENELRELFTLKLALVPKEGEVVRRRARRSECSDAQWTLVEAMAGRDWRLLTTGELGGTPVAEVAHEALLRHWPRAARWLDDSREFLIWKGQFEPECRDWEQAAESDRERALLTGLRLDAAIRWQRKRPNDLTVAESAFIADSQRATTARRQREQQAALRLARQRSWIQRLSATSLIVVAMVAVVAIWQGHNARLAEQAALAESEKAVAALDEAQRQAGLADARRLAMAAETVLDSQTGGTTLAGLIATESLRRSPTLEGQRVLRRVLSLFPRDAPRIETPWPRSDVHYSPDGRLVAFVHLSADGLSPGPAAGQIAMVDKRTWQRQAVHPQAGRAWPVVSPDGRWLAVAGYGRRLQVFDQSMRRKLLDLHQDDMFDAVFDARSERLYVARTDGVIEVREAPEWQPVSQIRYPVGAVRRSRVRVDIGPRGQQLLVHGQTAREGSMSPPLLVPVDGSAPVALGTKRALFARFSATGDVVATASWDHEVSLWDTATGHQRHAFEPRHEVSDLAFAPDGRTLFVATRSGEVQLTDTATGQVRRILSHTEWVNAVAVSPNGKRLATASDDRNAVVWNLETGERLWAAAHGDEVWAVAFDADGDALLTGGKDGALRVFDAATGRQRHQLQFDGGIRTIAHRPGAPALALEIRGSKHDQAWTDLQLVNRVSGTELARIEHNGQLDNLTFSPDSRTLATTTAVSGEVRLWDTASGRLRSRPGVTARALSFSADGRRLIGGDVYREAFVLDASDGRRLANLGEPGGIECVAVAPDRRTAITFGQDDNFRGWDLMHGALAWSRPAARPDTKGVVLSTNGQRFADLAADGRTIEVGDTRTGDILMTVRADEPSWFVLSGDGGSLVVLRTNLEDAKQPERRYAEVELWQVATGQRVLVRRLAHAIASVEALPGGAVAIMTRRSHGEPPATFEVLEAATGARRWSIETAGFGFFAVHRVAGQDDVVVVESTEANTVRALDTGRTRFERAGQKGRVVAVLPHDGLIAVRGDESIELRDARTGAVRRRVDDLGTIRNVQLGADGRRLLIAVHGSKRIGVWTWRTDDASAPRFIAMAHVARDLAGLADPDLFAVYDFADTLRVWRISTGQEVHRMSHTATATGIAVANAADRAVTWRGGSVRVWNTRDGSPIAHRLSHGRVTKLAVSPDGRTVAYLTDRPRKARRGTDFQALVLWEPDTSDEPAILPMESPNDLKFDPKGERLAVLRGGRVVQFIEVATLGSGASVQALPGSKFGPFEFSRDGSLLFVEESGEKHAFRAFRAASGQEMARIDGHPSLAPTPQAHTIAVRDDDGNWRAADIGSATPDDTLWRNPDDKMHFDHRAGRLLISSSSPPSGSLPEWLRGHLTLVPEVNGAPLNAWAVDAEGRRVAVVSDAGVSVHLVNGGQRLANWPGIQLHGGGILVGARPIRDLAFVDGGKALIAYDTRNYDEAEMASRLWLWRWQATSPRLLSEYGHSS